MSIYYLAYGSNLHPTRLKDRIPSTESVGIVELSGFQLHFHKVGEDQSGKCNIIETNNHNDMVLCALYHMDISHKPILDRIEGKGYTTREFQIVCDKKNYHCYAYVAEAHYVDEKIRPFNWYHSLVHLGAQYQQFPDDYLAQIEAVENIADHDPNRLKKNAELIDRIKATMPNKK